MASVRPPEDRAPVSAPHAAGSPSRRSGYRHFLAIPTRWMDNDSYGHVNNVTYYSYFDTAVNEHLIRAGGLDIRDDPCVGLVVETRCRFHKSLTFPETVDAGLRVAKLGTSSVTYEIGLFREGDDGYPVVLVAEPDETQKADAEDAAEICPAQAIVLGPVAGPRSSGSRWC